MEDYTILQLLPPQPQSRYIEYMGGGVGFGINLAIVLVAIAAL